MTRVLRALLAGVAIHAAGAHAAACSVSAVSLAFGNYSQFQALHNDVTSNIAVTCSGTPGEVVAYTITISSGSGTFTARRMKGERGVLSYNLYTSASRTTIWGDGSSGTSVRADAYTLTAPSVTRNYTLFGRTFAGQKTLVGSYGDSLVVTLNF